MSVFGCDSTVTTNILLLNTSSTNEIKEKSLSLKAFPNPFTKQMTLEVTADQFGPATIEVVNNIGQVIHREQVNLIVGQNTIPIEMKEADSGILDVVVFQQNSGVKTQVKVMRVRE